MTASARHRNAIADLVYTYALHVRRGEGHRCMELFTADAVYDMFDFDTGAMAARLRTRLEGRTQIGDYLTRASDRRTRVCPMIHNLIIEVRGDAAHSSCAMSAVVIPSGTDLVGEYEDTFRRDGGIWRFASRAHTILLQRPAPMTKD